MSTREFRQSLFDELARQEAEYIATRQQLRAIGAEMSVVEGRVDSTWTAIKDAMRRARPRREEEA